MKKIYVSLLMLWSTHNLTAQVLQDNFSTYIIGNDLNGQGGWSNSTSNPGGGGNCAGAVCNNQKISNTAISFPGYGSSSQSVVTGAGRDGVGKGWETNLTSGSVYAALVVNFSDIQCNSTCSNEFGFFRLQDRSGTFSFVLRLYIKKVSASTFQIGVEKGSSNNRVYTTTAWNFNASHLIVVKYTINNGSGADDVIRLYVNPDLSQAEPSVAEVNTNLGNDLSTSIDVAAVQLNFNSGGFLPVGNYGLVTVATQWNQVPFTPAAVSTIDRSFTNARVFAASSSHAVFQMNSTRADEIMIEITDLTGRVVFRQPAKLLAGRNSFTLETAALPKGIFNVRAAGSKGVSQTVRFMH